MKHDEWVMEQNGGVFFLLIRGLDLYGDNIDHIVAIDAGLTMIIDYCKQFNMQLAWKKLKACVGQSTLRRACARVDVRLVYC